ncbi:MAG TPA: hypothetical protein VMV69_06855 [Pirellulales bacterium]|nr:hypothetical protein [Pirellulales bacterium]
MRPEEFLRLLRQSPFLPFRLYLSTGMTFEVRHPEFAALERTTVWLSLPAVQRPRPIAEREVVVSLLHIVWIEFLEPTAASA